MSSRKDAPQGLPSLPDLPTLPDMPGLPSSLKSVNLSLDPDAHKPRANPLDSVDYEDNIEADSEKEVSATLQAFKDRAAREKERFDLVTDSEYWVALCFQSRGEKTAFLSALDLLKEGDKYLDGRLLADKLGITLPEEVVPYNTSDKVDPKLTPLARGKPKR